MWEMKNKTVFIFYLKSPVQKKNPKEPTKQNKTKILQESISKYRNIVGYKVNIKKSTIFLYRINNWNIKILNENKNTIYNSTHTQKYSSINITQYVQGFAEKHKTDGRNQRSK